MALSPLTLGVSLGAAILAVPAAVFTSETLASYLPRRRQLTESPTKPARLAVLMPAHDEAAGIESTVRAVLPELGANDRLIVVADNCSDDTAQIARDAGAEVLERTDPENRGKGYALSFGMEHLALDPPDCVIVMDADCRVSNGKLRSLAERALTSGRPTQAVYLMTKPESDNSFSGISAFAFQVRNLIRPRGLSRLGFPCELTGTGMAFPWAVFRDAPPTHGFLAEDRLLGHELAMRGAPPALDEDTLVVGELAHNAPSSLKQRRRWEHGGLSLLLQTAPRLLLQGIRRRNLGLIAQAFDSAVPPLALLVLVESASVAGSTLFWLAGGSVVPLAIAGGSFACLGLGVAAAWFGGGKEVLPLSEVMRIPGYVLWKLPLYLSFARHGAHSEWERTERNP